ncbi:MAG TPA: metalloregulator ArsR/SmtB family transcription factor [Patescibacteria group bacterium]|nr:metalloregulator ArsR/SmtB family transcription factor [Patescibacteria group bacterium]
MKELEKQLKALANRRRLAILKLLKDRRRLAVGDIADLIKLSLKATSKHLGVLYAAGIVEKEQVNVSVLYRLSDSVPSGARHIIGLL